MNGSGSQAIRWSIPRVVYLPLAETIDHNQLRVALAYPSRQTIALWRKQRDFPTSYRDGNSTFSMTSDVEKWLLARGVRVERI